MGNKALRRGADRAGGVGDDQPGPGLADIGREARLDALERQG